MELIALNSRWALFKYREEQDQENSLEALRSILSLNSCSDLMSLLKSPLLNDKFTLHLPSFLNNDYYLPGHDSINKQLSTLQGDLTSLAENDPSLEILEEKDLLYRRDDNKCGLIYIPDLLEFKKMIKDFFIYAAISLGSEAPEGSFISQKAEDAFEIDLEDSVFALKYSDLRVTYLPYDFINSGPNKFISSDVFEEEGTSPFILDEDVDVDLLDHDRGGILFPNKRRIIYFYSKDLFCPDFQERISCLCALHHKDLSKELVYKSLSGTIIESILNYCYLGAEQEQFLRVIKEDRCYYSYSYDIDKGYLEVPPPRENSWINDLFKEAISLIIEGKVSLCPICSKIILLKDSRGRKKRSFCSNSCKTIASQQRKKLVYELAQKNVPLKEALTLVGEEYRTSIIRWYSEAMPPT